MVGILKYEFVKDGKATYVWKFDYEEKIYEYKWKFTYYDKTNSTNNFTVWIINPVKKTVMNGENENNLLFIKNW